jgi:hypothetical protein
MEGQGGGEAQGVADHKNTFLLKNVKLTKTKTF